MFCPFCSEVDTKVIDSRLVVNGTQVRRRRSCPQCSERFTTFEVAELEMPQIIKRDGRVIPFNEKNIRQGMIRAFEKTDESNEMIEQGVASVMLIIRKKGEREISSQIIGEVVLEVLKELNSVAYIRFASVYLSLRTVEDFQSLIDGLKASDSNFQPKREEV